MFFMILTLTQRSNNVSFFVNASPLEKLDVATSNFAGA